MNLSSNNEPQSPPVDRSHWPVCRGTLKDLESDDGDLSATTTLEERWSMMWQLTQNAWAFRGEPIGEPPFPRHPVRIIRGRG
jgi:hypothetical protein